MRQSNERMRIILNTNSANNYKSAARIENLKRARDSVRNMRFSRVFLIFVIECLIFVV